MNALDLSRWQFGITTVYHFLFVPLTIGGAFFVAGFGRWPRGTPGHGRAAGLLPGVDIPWVVEGPMIDLGVQSRDR